jgi:hypothetical protein
MSVYYLTRTETWVLTTIFRLPVQPASQLDDWLGSLEVPTGEEIEAWIPGAIVSLDRKGYFAADNVKKSLSPDLLESLMLAAVGQRTIFTILRANGESVSTQFLLAGSGAVQYGNDSDQLIIHSPQQFDEILPGLLPEWLSIEPGGAGQFDMTQGAFLLFKQACLERDLAFVLQGNDNQTFSISNLEQSFARDNAWIDVFHALKVEGVQPFDPNSFPVDLEFLVSAGYLEKVDPFLLQIGAAGIGLAESLSDPDQVSISIGFTSLQPEKTITSVFLTGGKHLFQLDFLGEGISIIRIESRLAGLDWIRSQSCSQS